MALILAGCAHEAHPTSSNNLTAETIPFELRARIQHARTIGDVFPAERYIHFELTEHSALKHLVDVVFLNDSWYVIDEDLAWVYRFDETGKFLGTVGSVGQGPGEYSSAFAISRVFSGNLAIWDSRRSKIVVFDSEGQFVTETPRFGRPQFGNQWVYGTGLIWDDPKTLIATRLYNADGWHGEFNVKWKGEPGHSEILECKLTRTFGEPPTDKIVEAWGNRPVTDIEKVGENIWVANPFTTEITAYSKSYQAISIPDPCPSCAKYEDAEKQKKPTFLGYNLTLARVGPIIAVTHANKGMMLLDTAGNPLHKGHLLYDSGQLILDAFGDTIVTQFFKRPETLPFDEQLFFELNNYSDQAENNPVIRVGRL